MKAGKKLIVAMALISIVPSLAIAFVVNVQMQNSLHNLQRKSLESLANVVSAHIYDFCNGQEMDSRFFGEVTAYRECLEAHRENDSAAAVYWDGEVKNLFERTTTINDNIDGGALIDAEGVTILSYDESEEGKSLRNTDMYKRIMRGQSLYRSTVINEDGSRNINLVVPVKDDGGTVIGMLKRVVNLSNLNLYIDEVEIGDTGYVYVIDENATLIYHGSQDKMDLAVGEFQDREELDELLSQVADQKLEEKAGIIRYNSRGVETVAAYSQIEELDWVVLVAMDYMEVEGPVQRATKVIGAASVFVGLLTAAACYLIVRSLLFPLTQLRDRLREIVTGNYSARCEYAPGDELASVMECVNDMAIRMEREERELERAKSRDPLTGMLSRRAALEAIAAHLHAEERQAILLCDLDEFEFVNETMGQEAGDGILMELAEQFSSPPDCVYCVGRFSGDSFILMTDCADENQTSEAVAAWVREAVEGIRFVADRPVHVTASVGIAYIDDAEIDLNAYLKRAKIALHKAKNSGKNTDVVFTDDF